MTKSRSVEREPGGRAGPEPLRDILGRLFLARGWGRRQERLHLEDAWADCVGPETAAQTEVGGIRRGQLEIVVANSLVLQELAHYRQAQILQQMQGKLKNVKITNLKFRVGVIRKNK